MKILLPVDHVVTHSQVSIPTATTAIEDGWMGWTYFMSLRTLKMNLKTVKLCSGMVPWAFL